MSRPHASCVTDFHVDVQHFRAARPWQKRFGWCKYNYCTKATYVHETYSLTRKNELISGWAVVATAKLLLPVSKRTVNCNEKYYDVSLRVWHIWSLEVITVCGGVPSDTWAQYPAPGVPRKFDASSVDDCAKRRTRNEREWVEWDESTSSRGRRTLWCTSGMWKTVARVAGWNSATVRSARWNCIVSLSRMPTLTRIALLTLHALTTCQKKAFFRIFLYSQQNTTV